MNLVIVLVNCDYINNDYPKEILKVALKQEKYSEKLILHPNQGENLAS